MPNPPQTNVTLLLEQAAEEVNASHFAEAYTILKTVLSLNESLTEAHKLIEEINQRYGDFLYHEEIDHLAIESGHFHWQPEKAATLFKQTVKRVILETSSYCNRTCSFCPNSELERHTLSDNQVMSPELFNQIIDDLASIDYSGELNMYRYNEPLADPLILQRIATAREKLPNCFITLISNGDLLSRECIEQLSDAGLNILRLSFYVQEAPEYTHDSHQFTLDAEKLMNKRMQCLGFPFRVHKRVAGSCEATIEYPGPMGVYMVARNFQTQAYRIDRGGIFDGRNPKRVRQSPCFSLFDSINIEYNGKVMACVNLNSDHPLHQNYPIDTLDQTPGHLFTVFASKEAIKWRRHLLDFSDKKAPCDTCFFYHVEDNEKHREKIDTWKKLL